MNNNYDFHFFIFCAASLHVIVLNLCAHFTSPICTWTLCSSWKNALRFLQVNINSVACCKIYSHSIKTSEIERERERERETSFLRFYNGNICLGYKKSTSIYSTIPSIDRTFLSIIFFFISE